MNSEFFNVPSSHCYQSTIVTVTFIGHMFYLSQSEINFYIITAESNFEVRTGETIRCFLNIVFLQIFMRFTT